MAARASCYSSVAACTCKNISARAICLFRFPFAAFLAYPVILPSFGGDWMYHLFVYLPGL